MSGMWGRQEAGSTLRGLIWGHDGVLDFILLEAASGLRSESQAVRDRIVSPPQVHMLKP